jgi:aldehyde dehydrogenase (NAD+)
MQIDILPVLNALGIQAINEASSTGNVWSSNTQQNLHHVIFSPVDGKKIASVRFSNSSDYETAVLKAENAFKALAFMACPKAG